MKHDPGPWRPLALFFLLAWVLAATWGPFSASAQPPAPYAAHFELYRLPEPDAAGRYLLALFVVTPDHGYYIYANDPGESGQPTLLLPKAGPGNTIPMVRYPPGTPKQDILDPGRSVLVYEGPIPIFLLPPATGQALDRPQNISLALELRMLLCSEERCQPVRAIHSHRWDNVDIRTLPHAGKQPWWPLFLAANPGKTASRTTGQAMDRLAPAQPATPRFTPRYLNPTLEVGEMGKALPLAFLAGIILNLMPCVLPVIGLKLGALLAAAGIREEERRKSLFQTHCIFFALGMLLFFLVLSVVLALSGMMWGELFQNSGLVLLLAVVVLLLALSLFGLFTLPVVDLKAASGLAGTPRLQALGTGFLATLLATPCSAPLLGGVLAWAALKPPLVLATVFLCLGLGMASPYLLLAARPGLVRFFPKPGPWAATLEKFVGFFLLATCVYLLSILPAESLIPALAILLAAGFGGWMWGSWASLDTPLAKRLLIRGAALLLVAAVTFVALRPPSPEPAWEPFSFATFNTALGRENLVVEFTADWCPTCKVLERTTLSAKHVGKWQEQYNLRLLRADMTAENPEALALLRALGGASIPTMALFPTGREHRTPLILRDLFTPGQMEEALQSTFDHRP